MLLAFHGDKTIKAKYLNRLKAHAAADEIIHGTYWERGKGCAVGCTVHSSSHVSYETELGIPRMLARLEDRIFEGLQNGESKKFPVQFLLSIKVGADLSRVGWQFLHWLLIEELVGRDHPKAAAAIKRCADVLVPLTKGEPCDKTEAAAARDGAWQARRDVYAAAAYAAAAADAAYAAAAAAAAAAADAAADAAYAAAAYADAAAAYAADAAAAAYADAAAARRQAYSHMAKKLIELMTHAPVVKQPRAARRQKAA